MCIKPSRIYVDRGPHTEVIQVPCRDCWSCRADRINDYVGRCLCEASTSDDVQKVELTYAPWEKRPWDAPGSLEGTPDLAERVITPPHAQYFIRMLRNRVTQRGKVGSIRYLICGEYGGEKGRAHFHAILFFRGIEPGFMPRYKNGWEARNWIPEWPHGHIFPKPYPDESAMRYVAKYVYDDKSKPDAASWFSLSKKPTIGSAWFAAKADSLFEAGLMPTGFEYMPPGGKPGKKYLMTGATKRDYLMRLYLRHLEVKSPAIERLNHWVKSATETYERLAIKKEVEKIDRVAALQAKSQGWEAYDLSSIEDRKGLTEAQAAHIALKGLDWEFFVWG